MSQTHPNARKLRDAMDKVSRRSLDVGDAFAPDLLWRIVGNHPLAGDYHGLDVWRTLMRRRSELTGGTYRPQPQAWLGSDRHRLLLPPADRPARRRPRDRHVARRRVPDG